MAAGRPAPYPHTRACRERMEAIIRVEEPARWRKAILRKRTSDGPGLEGASESEGEGEGVDRGSASAPLEDTLEESPDRTMSAEYVGLRGFFRSLNEASLHGHRGIGGTGSVNRPDTPVPGKSAPLEPLADLLVADVTVISQRWGKVRLWKSC